MLWLTRMFIGLLGVLTLAWFGITGAAEPQPRKAQTRPVATQPSATQPARQEKVEGAAPSVPTAEDVIEAFERERPPNVPIVPSNGGEAAPGPGGRRGPESGPRARLPDGFLLADRTGRLVRDGEWWTFVFESDSDSRREPPMRLLPNRMLERMVFEAEGATEGQTFLVSGEVTEFRGENYLLLRKLLRRRGDGNLEK